MIHAGGKQNHSYKCRYLIMLSLVLSLIIIIINNTGYTRITLVGDTRMEFFDSLDVIGGTANEASIIIS
jgi:hypothetical protein